MPFVLTVDQRESRRTDDIVNEAVQQLAHTPTVLGFVRTVGDEFQGLLDDPLSVVAVILKLMRTSAWHIGLGVGSVLTPLPADTRSARGDAFVSARAAVDNAKNDPSHLSVVAAAPAEEEGHDAEVVFRLVAALRERRSAQGWEAIDLINDGRTMADAADELQISRQAVGQRLQAAKWATEQEAVPVLARLLARAERLTVPAGADGPAGLRQVR